MRLIDSATNSHAFSRCARTREQGPDADWLASATNIKRAAPAPAEGSRITANPCPTQPRRSITHGFCRGIV